MAAVAIQDVRVQHVPNEQASASDPPSLFGQRDICFGYSQRGLINQTGKRNSVVDIQLDRFSNQHIQKCMFGGRVRVCF